MIKYSINNQSLESFMKETFNFTCSSSISVSSNIDLYLVLHKDKRIKIRYLGKKLAYPILLWFVAVLFSLFYCLYFSEVLIGFLNDFDVEPTIIYAYKSLSSIVIVMFLFVVLIIFVGFYIYRKMDLMITFLLKYQNRGIGKYFNQIISYQFVKLFTVYHVYALSIQDVLREIMEMTRESSKFWVASSIRNDLINGKSLEISIRNSYLNKDAQDFLNSIQFDCERKSFQNHLEVMKEDIRQSEKTIIRWIKLLSYLSIFVSVILFYLSLLVPLKIMEGL
ncbi:MAG: hypothetical protein RR565_04420 [Erysipelothrix sp.]